MHIVFRCKFYDLCKKQNGSNVIIIIIIIVINNEERTWRQIDSLIWYDDQRKSCNSTKFYLIYIWYEAVLIFALSNFHCYIFLLKEKTKKNAKDVGYKIKNFTGYIYAVMYSLREICEIFWKVNITFITIFYTMII